MILKTDLNAIDAATMIEEWATRIASSIRHGFLGEASRDVPKLVDLLNAYVVGAAEDLARVKALNAKLDAEREVREAA